METCNHFGQRPSGTPIGAAAKKNVNISKICTIVGSSFGESQKTAVRRLYYGGNAIASISTLTILNKGNRIAGSCFLALNKEDTKEEYAKAALHNRLGQHH